MIKDFEVWWFDNYQGIGYKSKARDAYEGGVKAASDHFEEEKIKIHEYYAAKLADLFEHEQFKGSEENNGKLT